MDSLYRMQQKDRRERVRLRALIGYLRESFASLPYGAVMIDPENNIEWSNRAAETLLGLRFPEDTGQQIVNLVRAPEFVAYFDAEDYSSPLETALAVARRCAFADSCDIFRQAQSPAVHS